MMIAIFYQILLVLGDLILLGRFKIVDGVLDLLVLDAKIFFMQSRWILNLVLGT